MEGMNLALSRLREALIEKIELPDWLLLGCPECDYHCGHAAITDISVILTPKFFGNVAIGVLCPGCSTISEFHFREGAPDADLKRFLSLPAPPSPAVLRHVLEAEPAGVLEKKLWSQSS
jgi:hypothetical protein